MADTKISALDELAATPAALDMLELLDVSDTTMDAAGTNKRFDASRIAYRANNNTFTKAQVFQPDGVGLRAVAVEMPSATSVNAIEIDYNTELRVATKASSGETSITLQDVDLGNDVRAPYVEIMRNSNAGAEGPAPGVLELERSGGGQSAIWADASNDLRIHTAAPTGSTGTPTVDSTSAGVVVGTQSSHEKFKNVLGDGASADDCLVWIRKAIKSMRVFKYKDNRYNGTVFDGIILHDEDHNGLSRYGMDPDEEHTSGKSLNEINAISDLMRVVAWQQDQINELTDQIAALTR